MSREQDYLVFAITARVEENLVIPNCHQFISSGGIQGQPKSRVIFSRRNWNRFWNREPFGPGTVGGGW
jgi:hypothetical protein